MGQRIENNSRIMGKKTQKNGQNYTKLSAWCNKKLGEAEQKNSIVARGPPLVEIFLKYTLDEISSLAISAVSDPSDTVSTVATVSFSTKANVGSSSSKVSLLELNMSAMCTHVATL